MRQPLIVLRYLVILMALCFAARAHADDRADARAHYQAGVKFYASGDYRSAIREFSSAQQLVPADLNNYNLALCYDKLGDAEPAIQYYRAFLDKQPSSDKRAEIEASISRLEAAARSAASKKADEARRVDEARKAEDARKADELRRQEEERNAVRPAPVAPPIGPSEAPGPGAPSAGPAPSPKSGPAVAGSLGTPSTGTPAPTGDSQLDRVGSINIDQIRDQRVGGASSGMPDMRGGPAVGQSGQPPAGPSGPNVAMGPASPTGPTGSMGPTGMNGQPLPGTDQPPKKPLYKKWWFWAVIAVSSYVVYEIASAEPSTRTRGSGITAPPPPSGLTLMRW
jgi:hypothetical protein